MTVLSCCSAPSLAASAARWLTLGTLRHVSALLDAKAPNDAVALKDWLRHAKTSCDAAAQTKKLSGAAKTSFTNKCVRDAVGT